MNDVLIYAPLAKVESTEDGGREVSGFATLEKADKKGEIADYESTVEAFKTWSDEIQLASGGKSKGNIREMHQPKAVGKVIDWFPSEKVEKDTGGNEISVKGIYVTVRVPPSQTDTIEKLDEGILTGFSIGGKYAKKWMDVTMAKMRYTPKLSELSLVDNPAVPGATYDVVKGDAIVLGENLEKKAPGGSFEDLRNQLNAACTEKYKGMSNYWDGYIVATYPDKIIVYNYASGKYFEVPYEAKADGIELGQETEVEQTYVPVTAQKMVEAELQKRAAKSKEDEQKDAAKARAKKYGISFKEGKGHLAPLKDYPTDEADYGDPVNYAYPTDSEHIDAAVEYFNHDGQRTAGDYSEAEWEIIGNRIAKAAGEGYSFKDGKIDTPSKEKDKGEGVEKTAKSDLLKALIVAKQSGELDTILAELQKAASSAQEELDNPASPEKKEESLTKNDNPEDLQKYNVAISKQRMAHLEHARRHIQAAMTGEDYSADQHAEMESTMGDIKDGSGAETEVVAKLIGASLQKAAGFSFEQVSEELQKFDLAKAAEVGKIADSLGRMEAMLKGYDERLMKIEDQPAGMPPMLNGLQPLFKFNGQESAQNPEQSKHMLEDLAKNEAIPLVVRQQIGTQLALMESPFLARK